MKDRREGGRRGGRGGRERRRGKESRVKGKRENGEERKERVIVKCTHTYKVIYNRYCTQPKLYHLSPPSSLPPSSLPLFHTHLCCSINGRGRKPTVNLNIQTRKLLPKKLHLHLQTSNRSFPDLSPLQYWISFPSQTLETRRQNKTSSAPE